jgi:hypothetical protein
MLTRYISHKVNVPFHTKVTYAVNVLKDTQRVPVIIKQLFMMLIINTIGSTECANCMTNTLYYIKLTGYFIFQLLITLYSVR